MWLTIQGLAFLVTLLAVLSDIVQRPAASESLMFWLLAVGTVLLGASTTGIGVAVLKRWRAARLPGSLVCVLGIILELWVSSELFGHGMGRGNEIGFLLSPVFLLGYAGGLIALARWRGASPAAGATPSWRR